MSLSHFYLSFQNNVVANDDNSRMIIDQQSQNVVSPSMVLNLWQQQLHLSAKQHQHPNSMSGSHRAKTMEEPRLPNRTITMRVDADVTPIISHQHRLPSSIYNNSNNNNNNNNRTATKNKRINNAMSSSDKSVTCDKVNNNCNDYCSSEEESDLWTFSTTTTATSASTSTSSSAVPVKLKLLSRFMCQKISAQLTMPNVNNNKNDSDIDRNIGSDFQIGKCKNFNVKSSRASRNSVFRKTIFWQCFLIFMYIFLLNLSTSTCFAARQEGRCVF